QVSQGNRRPDRPRERGVPIQWLGRCGADPRGRRRLGGLCRDADAGVTLSRLTLAQFRSWPRLALDFDARPVALHGPNGAGKTNILEALSMLAPGRGLRGAAAAEQARLSVGAGWRIRARFAGHEIVTGAPPGGSRSVMLDDKPV